MGKNPPDLYGISVKEIKMLAQYAKEALVVLAIKERDQFEAMKIDVYKRQKEFRGLPARSLAF